MKDHVFQTFREVNDRMQFNKTLEALGNYINKNLKHPGDLVPLYKKLDTPSIDKPEDISTLDFADEKLQWQWKEDMRRYLDRMVVLENNLRLLYAVVWGQCSEAMKAKIEGMDDFEAHDTSCDCKWLLTNIRSTMYQFEGKKHLFVAMLEARTKVERCTQKPGQDLTTFFHEFKETIEAFEHYGGLLGIDLGLVNSLIDERHQGHPGEQPEYIKDKPEESFKSLLKYHQQVLDYRVGLEHLSRNRILAIMFLQ